MLIGDEYNTNDNPLYLCDESVVGLLKKVAKGIICKSPIMPSEFNVK